ncbi:MAG: hypothetical protein V8R99_10505 [Eubacterium ventriosum]|jgi:hypothetical protein|uniref:hypothetical protein n=1 Tax=Eubacterium ventriosum TaxID=39496 RepID=UPI00300E8DBF
MKKRCFIFIGIIIYILPISLIIFMSYNELKKYKVEVFDYTEFAYGDIFKVEYNDMKEKISIKAKAVSNTTEKYVYDEKIVWMVNIGEEIHKNQIIGYGSDKILSKTDGIVKVKNDKYVIIESFKKIIWEAEVNALTANYLKEGVFNANGDKIKVCDISNSVKNNLVTVRFEIENMKAKYGEIIEDLELNSNETLENVLTVNKKCVLEREGKHFVRIVDEKGRFLYEQQIDVGYEDDENICVSGLDEGTLCDGGYSEYIE